MPRSRFLILTAILTFIPLVLSAQTLRGHVYIAGTDTVIAGASVYYNASTTGTITDKYGQFELPARSQQIPVTISCVGYFSSTVNYEPNKPLIVYLKPKVVELKTVTIRTNDLDRKQEERLFVQEFLGISEFAKSCTIVNLDDVDLYYNNKTGMLTADCEKPIIIQNKKLGYIVTYYLDNFSRTISSTHYAGNFNFKEDSAISSADRTKILSNRERAYNGSRMQFIRALWRNTLDRAGFIIKDQRSQPLALAQILRIDSLKQKYLYLENGIFIYHNSDLSYKNILNTARKYIFIDQNGYYAQGLEWTGRMSDQRVGDQLPYEYQPKSELVENALTANVNSSAAAPAIAESPPNSPAGTKTASGKPIPVFFEKAYLHTDREHYLTGENIWFKAYLVNARDNKLINTSNTLYVELIAPGAVVRDKKLIRLEDGLGQGDFKLSDSLYAGTYRLRAYTNWMRNFGDNFVFEKELKIYGGKRAKPQPAKPVLAMLPDKRKIIMAPPLQAQATIAQAVSETIRFFPEGGSMVENISGTMAYKAEDGNGRNIGLKGVIETQSGEKIADVNTVTGMGSFLFKPLTSVSYFAKGQYANGNTFKLKLPTALLTGLAMQVSNRDSIIVITLAADQEMLNKTLLLTCKSKGKIYKSVNVIMTQPTVTLRIPAGELPAGVNCLTLYDEANKPDCERLVYIDNNEKPPVQLLTDKNQYASKEKTTLTINAPANTKLSVAVTDAGLVGLNQVNISSYLKLQSELRGKIENPNQYFDNRNPDRKKQLDLLLLTQGWRDFVWRRLADSALRISYIAEKGLTVSGNVKEIWSEKPVPNINITLFADSAVGNKIFTARTDNTGRFYIDGLHIYGNQPIDLTAVNDKGIKKGWITVDTAWQKKYPAAKLMEVTDTSTRIKVALQQRIKDARSLPVPGAIALKEVTIVAHPLSILKKYGDSVLTIGRKDYRYKTLGAYAASVYARYRALMPKGGWSSSHVSTVFTSDSIPAMRTRFINFYDMPMDRIVSVHVQAIHYTGTLNSYQREQLFPDPGDSHNFGDVYCIWFDLVLQPHALDEFDFHVANLHADGYYKARTFYAPRYETADTKPDLRTTIHWEPNIVTDKNGQAVISYYNADPKTNVLVAVEGVTDKGEPIAISTGYTIK